MKCVVVASLMIAGTTLADWISVPGDYDTIGEAILNAESGDEIRVDEGTYFESDFHFDHGYDPPNNVKISGMFDPHGKNPTIINGQNNGSIMTFWCGGFEFQNIKFINASNTALYLHEDNSMILSNCVFENNSGGQAGAVVCAGATVWMNDCTFTGNSGTYGGAIRVGDGIVRMKRCVVTDNSASYHGGGGISSGTGHAPVLEDCTVCSNVPDQVAGGYTDNGGNCISTICDSDGDGVLDCIDALIGPCCLETGCLSGTNDQCAMAGGTWLGKAGDCADCPPPSDPGVCCVSSGCSSVSQTVCSELGGTWVSGGSCDDCPPPPSAGCDLNGDGVVDIADLIALHAELGVCVHDTDYDADTDIQDLLNLIDGWGGLCP